MIRCNKVSLGRMKSVVRTDGGLRVGAQNGERVGRIGPRSVRGARVPAGPLRKDARRRGFRDSCSGAYREIREHRSVDEESIHCAAFVRLGFAAPGNELQDYLPRLPRERWQIRRGTLSCAPGVFVQRVVSRCRTRTHSGATA